MTGPGPWTFRGRGPLRGTVELPGDKSISHRACLLNALGEGAAVLRGLNPGADVDATLRALRAVGVSLRGASSDAVEIRGRGGRLRPATDRIDCGNSGTTLRILAGLLAAQDFTSTLDGDASLRARPMDRIATPLRAMGARVEGPSGGDRPPLIVTGGRLRGGRFELPVASAQVKSCILVAAAAAKVAVEVVSPGASRDHTECMLAAMGADIEWSPRSATFRPGGALRAVDVTVPGDPSAAALVGAAVSCVPGSEVRFEHVLLNATRVGFLDVLRRMGVEVRTVETPREAGEAVGTLEIVGPATLRATVVGADEIPGLIDEVPALAVVAAFAAGDTRFERVGELRVKESDRVASVQRLLAAVSIPTSTPGDALVVHGGAPRLAPALESSDDHRIAMAACGLGAALVARSEQPNAACTVDDVASCAVSFPGFCAALERLAS
jgi:3-phosphoshikimate 1-carboxyvinyltransferase